MALLGRVLRRLRYGRHIVVVSGLPRSGTSMAMKMLQAGGIEVVTDGVRQADQSNPKGYFEFEAVKELEHAEHTAWLKGARGKAVKIISFLLPFLPEDHDYRVVFMQRDLDEVLASQNEMLVQRGEAAGTPEHDVQLRRHYEQHLAKVDRLLLRRSCFSVLKVEYRSALERPHDEARRINQFVGGNLDVARMATVSDSTLYRNRSGAGS